MSAGRRRQERKEEEEQEEDGGGGSCCPAEPAKTSQKQRVKRSGSNVFAMFTQHQVQEFKEAFQMIDQDKDGFISKNDIRATFDSLGRLATEQELDSMVSEAPGPINFTMFLSIFGDRISGTDEEDVIMQAFKLFDDGDGKCEGDKFRHSLVTWGEKFSAQEADDAMNEAPSDPDGRVDLKRFAKLITGGAEEEEGASTNTNIGFEEFKEFVNVLGLRWQPRTDGFTFKGIALPLNSMTKRGIPSQTGLEWDDPIPEELRRKLTLINQDLPSLEHIQIPRCVVPGNFMKVEFHGFCDASQKAYAASLYPKVILSNTSAKTFLLVAKTRVAPMKVVSLPKLELCSALLLARLVKTVDDNLPLTMNEIYLWSDSTIALCWINSEPCRRKTFVANRDAEIHRLVSGVWCHVDGRQNPADCASRGIFPSDLVKHPLWWNGPPWLIEPALEIKKFINSSKEEFKEEEKIKTYFGTIECEIPSIVINCSSLTKLKCIIAWCLRFVNNSRMPSHSRNREPLTLRELNDALLTVVKGIIRVGGRLKNVNVHGDWINKVLLPKSHHLTTLIVNNVHVHNLHSSTQATLSAIRNIFWIPSGRNVVRKILRTCMKCARLRKEAPFQLMGNLPFARINRSRPFLVTGIEFAGPLLIKRDMGRTTSTMNAYVALFICFSTRAIHLELISRLTTDALISTIRRFIARRGKPATIHSDNATNFVGAHKIIGKLCYNASKVLTNSEGIHWKFIPPSAPHFGGLWEAGVKSMKYHLRRTIGSSLLNFEELSTLLAQIEACLKLRPLCPLSEDPEDLQVLTPGHFLIGGSLTALPDEDDIIAMRLPNRWQLIQKSMNHFWTRWSQEYVSQLQQRSKWCKPQPNIKEGSLVLIKNEQQPPLAWKIGRISKVFPGDDARIRVVEVKTANGTYRRLIVKLCVVTYIMFFDGPPSGNSMGHLSIINGLWGNDHRCEGFSKSYRQIRKMRRLGD
ncbi:hypothetical protein LAZ67_4003244 [Cordylochernes scorpioides]|uniref:Integrase catalytic domain-containing protein n=1 Tax=Cordylochernes scorpioides TaxID=51811 RepID=A0ABY6KDN3_9ARAC|nr:hypothetical protein LAZ67_4003244 [Cordylochernes scorpioides]